MISDLILLEPAEQADLPAGEFSDWLTGMVRAIRGEQSSDVACGDCDACCRGSYFIELKPEDDPARQRIPAELLFAAPGAPAGFQVLGYDQQGRCPMLKETGCAIYADRPLTCRTYDCRIFAATGIAEAAPEKADVTARSRRWRFSYRDDASRAQHRLLRLGTRVLLAIQQDEADSALPRTATQLAMLAVQLHEHFQTQAALLRRRSAAEEAMLRTGILEAAGRLLKTAERRS